MKKIFLLIIITNFINAQENRVLKYNFQDKNGHNCNSSLYLVNNESIFKVEDSRNDGLQPEVSDDGPFVIIMNDSISKVIYSTKTHSIVRIPLYKSEILYKLPNNVNKFELTGKVKTIEKFNCQEAKLKLNSRIYSIWFAPEIIVNYGPFKINGLPGLIVEIYEETNKTRITLKSIDKITNTNEFEKLKSYILARKILEYQAYEKKVISIMCKNKALKIAKMRELDAEIEFNESQESFTQNLIDVPKNLVKELKKIN
jgi:GLPGLI family protein